MWTFRLLLNAGGMLVVLSILAATVLVCRLMVATRAETAHAQRAAHALLSKTPEICAEHRAAKQALDDARREAKTLKARLPDAVDDTRFLEQLSHLAQRTAVEPHSFRPGTTADLPTHKELEVCIQAGGEYEGLCRLLAELARLPRCYRISQLNLAAPANGDKTCNADVQIWLAFGLKQPSQTTGAVP
jgi:Tfp pilus assembly protein PilO